ncbi:MAG: DDE-type integrase/transposase/recombinase [Nanoarchaeota archaeon]
MAKTGYLERYRNPIIVIRFAIILHIYLPSRIVSILLFLLFRASVSYKTVCEWTKKFANNLTLPEYSCLSDILICHADEKYVKVKGEWNYWWSLKDCFGNLIHTIITPLRDFDSAKKLLKEARLKIGREVDILVRDGLYAYDKSTKFLGRKCKSVVAGINGKGFIYKKKFYWITNNPSESLNSEIDSYLEKFRYNFENIESANRFANLFMLRKHLKKMFYEKKLLEASSMLEQAFTF